VAVTAEWLVNSIDGLVEGGHISKEFVGVILLPIVGNAAGLSDPAPLHSLTQCRTHILIGIVEHLTAVTVSVKDKLTLSLGVAVGSSIVRHLPELHRRALILFLHSSQQIALFIIPFIVTLAWILGKPLTMLFDPYESIVLFLSGGHACTLNTS
jgi:Ca2+:H+ antiporter